MPTRHAPCGFLDAATFTAALLTGLALGMTGAALITIARAMAAWREG